MKEILDSLIFGVEISLCMIIFLFLVLLIVSKKKGITIIELLNDASDQMRQDKCKHEKWDMDNQIRKIRCRSCKKEAWVEEYKNLF